MKSFKNLILFTFIFLLLSKVGYAEQKFKFLNLDQLIKETKIGQEMLDKINQIDKSNLNQLNLFEDELKKMESEINSKKNIISSDEFEKEVKAFKKKVDEFNEEKNMMVRKLNETKKKELNIFFNKIKPLIQNYMDQNSIDMIFNSKNIFMGNKNSDLTILLIDEINNNI